jgi:hypothetical protein
MPHPKLGFTMRHPKLSFAMPCSKTDYIMHIPNLATPCHIPNLATLCHIQNLATPHPMSTYELKYENITGRKINSWYQCRLCQIFNSIISKFILLSFCYIFIWVLKKLLSYPAGTQKRILWHQHFDIKKFTFPRGSKSF